MRTVYVYYAALLVMLAAQPHTSPARELSPAAQEASYAFAVQSFREQRYSAAFGRFARLADAGHAPSAQLALMMVRNGRALFGSDWDATPEQLERWSALVVNSERRIEGSADVELVD